MCELEKLVSISSNHKCCIEGGLLYFNYKHNLTSKITLTFFPSLVAFMLSSIIVATLALARDQDKGVASG